MNIGLPYHYARIMLLDQEIEETHDAYLTIETLDQSFEFRVKRSNPEKIVHYFSEGPYSSIRLLMTGAGLCMAIDAGFAKYANEPWVIYGTISLVIFNAGLCFIGQAVYHKTKLY